MSCYRPPHLGGEAILNMTIAHGDLTILYWMALVAAGLSLAISALVLVRRRHIYPRLRNREPRRWAVSNVLFSIFLLTNLIPRLAGAPNAVTLAMSLVAFVFLFGAVATYPRPVRTPAEVQHGSTATDPPEPDRGGPQQAI